LYILPRDCLEAFTAGVSRRGAVRRPTDYGPE
jgi:hypothetical protein